MVKGLKSNLLWNKIYALYPFAGSTASQQKYNLKNPQDTNAAYRLTFTGTGIHSNLGWYTNNVCHANTNLIPSIVLNVNSNGLTIVSGTNAATLTSDTVEMGAYNNNLTTASLVVKGDNTTFRKATSLNTNQNGAVQDGVNDAKGVFTGSKTTSNVHKLFRNSALLGSGTGGGSLPNVPIFVGAMNVNSGVYGRSSQRIQFAAIHQGLTDTEVANFHSIIDAYQLALGRKTW